MTGASPRFVVSGCINKLITRNRINTSCISFQKQKKNLACGILSKTRLLCQANDNTTNQIKA